MYTKTTKHVRMLSHLGSSHVNVLSALHMSHWIGTDIMFVLGSTKELTLLSSQPLVCKYNSSNLPFVTTTIKGFHNTQTTKICRIISKTTHIKLESQTINNFHNKGRRDHLHTYNTISNLNSYCPTHL